MTMEAAEKHQDSQYNEALARAYRAGYMAAVNQEKKRWREAKQRRERKKYFAVQKAMGVAILIFTAAAVKAFEGDATVALLTIPLAISLLLSKEMLIINKYYWQCEEKQIKR